MKIKSLRLKNFKSFEDETYFDFETNNNQNVILIGGENGAGKSSLFEAMKLCIYGPLTYRYQGFVSTYIAKIKSYMNYNVFKNEDVYAFVEMEIYFNVDGEEDIYKLKREWTFEDYKLKEEFTVWKKDEKLEGEQLDYFDSYLKNNVPPDIFDLFFFDGEQLAEFFIGRNSDLRLKEILLTLCNYDNFDILRKELSSNRHNRYKKDDDLANYSLQLEKVEEKLGKLYKNYERTSSVIDSKIKKIEKINLDYDNLYKEFEKAGGIFFKEREELTGRLNYLENLRVEINQEIKNYSNEILPFIIVKDMLNDIKDQLYLEEEYIAYQKINERLSHDELSNIFENVLGNQLVSEDKMKLVVEKISEQIFPKSLENEFKSLHLVSKEQHNNIISLINKINDENVEEANYFEQLLDISEEISKVKKKLNSSLRDEEQEIYIKKLEQLNKFLLSEELEVKELTLEKMKIEEEIILLGKEKEKVEDQIILCKQAANVKDMSDGIVNMLDDIILSVTKEKVKQVEKHFEDIFKSIIRKDRFIDFIEVEDDFTISLYVKKHYSVQELIKLVINVGLDDMEKKYGKKFMEDLNKIYDFNNKVDLLELMNMDDYEKIYPLNTKVDILGLSSGEKQIYILCLYWALIKTSKVELPFVIDTPYGRIDEKHRVAISINYFTEISEQVIVFSTNTEIDEGLYATLKPYVAKEYLLKYNTKKRKSIVKEGYFYEVNLWDTDLEHQKRQKISLRA